jgi:hypothetical protein
MKTDAAVRSPPGRSNLQMDEILLRHQPLGFQAPGQADDRIFDLGLAAIQLPVVHGVGTESIGARFEKGRLVQFGAAVLEASEAQHLRQQM